MIVKVNGRTLALRKVLIFLNTETEDGYNIIKTRVKWGGVIERELGSLRVGGLSLYISPTNSFCNI